MRWSFILIPLLILFLIPLKAQQSEPEVVTRQRKKMKAYQQVLEQIRKQKFKQDIAVGSQTAEEFNQYLKKELAAELSEERNYGLSKTFQLLGLGASNFDYKKTLEQLLGSQAAAFYSPKEKKFFFVALNFPEKDLAPIIVHELHHGLQDQYYDLQKMFEVATESGSEDVMTALRFLIEGEATFSMNWYALIQILKKNFNQKVLKLALEQQGATKRKELEAQYSASRLEWSQKAAQALKETPDYFFYGLYFPYLKGAISLGEAYREGGWERVDQLFQDPPTTTEQFLHFKEKYLRERDYPMSFRLPITPTLFSLNFESDEGPENAISIESKRNLLIQLKESAYQRILETTFGELGLFSFMKQHFPTKDAERIAAGWDGDLLQAFEKENGEKFSLLWLLTFDTIKDAKEAEEAFQVYIQKWQESKLSQHQLTYNLSRVEKDLIFSATEAASAKRFHEFVLNHYQKRENRHHFYKMHKVCPSCDSDKIIPILYGLPSKFGQEKAKAGELILGGCFIYTEKWCCKICQQRW